MKEFKISCPHCQQHIAFPESNAGQVIACPSCGLSVGLNVPGYAPHKKSHSVFYYVFWGVLSLVVTVMILGVVWVVFLGGLVAVPAAMQAYKHKTQSAAAHSAADSTNAPAAVSAESELARQKSAYKQFLQISEATARYRDSALDGRVPGIWFRLKNLGTKTVTRVEVTVYFKDASGKNVSEEKFYPVSVSQFNSDSKPLKPGYIWQMEDGHFYAAKNVPTEWREGKVELEITDLSFE